jgi:hypothetical protein
MSPLDAYIEHLAELVADEIVRVVASLPRSARLPHIIQALNAVSFGLGHDFLVGLHGHTVEESLAMVLADWIASETVRIVFSLDEPRAALGLDAPPSPPVPQRFEEGDDIAQHNDGPSKKKGRAWSDWQAHLYRGVWLPAYQTAIADLTPDDVGLASAYLAGKLTQKGCPKSDKAKKADRWNLAYRIVHGIEMVAGIVASVVLGVVFGPLGGLLTTYLHKAKMAALDHFWRLKVARDPAFKALVEQLNPTEWYTFNGFHFQLRPVGNMLMQELGCKGDLRTRLGMHGRLMRTLDVLASSSPTAKSAPGRYDYPSAFGPLKGSIFPPRGPQFDGTPPTPPIVAQAKKVVMSAPIQAVINRPSATLSATVQHMSGGTPVPKGLARSAALLQAKVQKQVAATVPAGPQMTASVVEMPAAPGAATNRQRNTMGLLLLGGAALGAAFLATR